MNIVSFCVMLRHKQHYLNCCEIIQIEWYNNWTFRTQDCQKKKGWSLNNGFKAFVLNETM